MPELPENSRPFRKIPPRPELLDLSSMWVSSFHHRPSFINHGFHVSTTAGLLTAGAAWIMDHGPWMRAEGGGADWAMALSSDHVAMMMKTW